MMKFQFLILSAFLILCLSCTTAQKPYELGIEECKQSHQESMMALLEKAKKGLPTEPVITSRDCLIGLSLPLDLEISTTKGSSISREELRGKKSVINFWFSSCPPCIAEIPMFNELADSYPREDVNFISIGKDPKAEVNSFLEKYKWNFIHASNGMYLDEDVFKLYFGYPLTIVVDEDLVIKAIFPSFNEEKLNSGEALKICQNIIDSI